MKIGIVTHYQVVSHLVVSQRIQEVFTKLGHECTLHNFEDREIPEKKILFVGTLFAENLSYLHRFIPDRQVVFHATADGFPILDPKGIEKKVAESIPILACSRFVKMCLESVNIPVAEIVYHGIDMKQTEYDKEYYNYLKQYIKGPVVFCNSGNIERKGLDRFLIGCKLVSRLIPKAFFILHSGDGFVKIPNMAQNLELENFWYTNAFGMLPWPKLNAIYNLCTVYSQPSYCGGFELPIVEAFRFNKPVVAVDVEPYNEIIDNGKTGYLIPCKKVQQTRYLDRFMFPLHLYSINDLADALAGVINSAAVSRYDFMEAKEKFDADRTYPRILGYF